MIKSKQAFFGGNNGFGLDLGGTYEINEKWTASASFLDVGTVFYKNDVEHQKTNTECGVYCLFTITHLLTNKIKLKDFDKRIPDSHMEELRTSFFN